MSKGTFAIIATLLAGAVGATYYIKPELFGQQPDVAPEATAQEAANQQSKSEKNKSKAKKKKGAAFDGIKLVTTTDWANTSAKKESLAKAITAELGSKSAAEFAKNQNSRLLAAQWIIANADTEAQTELEKATADREKKLADLKKQLENKKALVPEGVAPSKKLAWDLKQLEKNIKRAETSCKAAYTMEQALKDPKAATIMERIAADPEWAEQFAFTGDCIRPGYALYLLTAIANEHADFFSNKMVRDIATATALEYAKSNWHADDAVDRAEYYIKNYKANRLNTVFDTLPFWQRRMVCGCKGDNPYGSVASLEWSLENVHIPAHEYPGSCWRCSYRLNNIYGDSIHGPQYYAPWEASYGDNRTALTYLVGGVCGSLSHFGAFSALANGIPALTAGEPGHCAFIVLVDKKWTPAYSLSWERGLHWQVYRNVYSFSSLHSASELFDSKNEATTNLSNTYRIAANIFAQQGDKAKAQANFCDALKTEPRNFYAWREWVQALSESGTADDWAELNETLCNKLVPIYPEMAYEVMQKGAIEGMSKAMAKDEKKLRRCFLDFWNHCDTYGPDRWHIARLADAQLKALGISAKTPDKLCSIYGDILASCAHSANYMSVILGWGNNISANLSEADKKKFMDGMVKGIQKGDNMKDEDKEKLLAPALLAAEKSGDIVTFQALAKMLPDKYRNPANILPKHEPFPGKLASQGGIVLASSTSQWDKPCNHWGLLEPCGGTFHTAKDTDAWITVQLPRQVNVTGVVLITNPGNLHRLHNMKIQVSEDGQNWTDVHQFGPCNQRVMRADLGQKLPLAKYVRILRPGGPEFFHLNGIYVYGNQAA